VKPDPAHASAEWSRGAASTKFGQQQSCGPPAATAKKCGISILAERWSGELQFYFELYFKFLTGSIYTYITTVDFSK